MVFVVPDTQGLRILRVQLLTVPGHNAEYGAAFPAQLPEPDGNDLLEIVLVHIVYRQVVDRFARRIIVVQERVEFLLELLAIAGPNGQ